MEVEQVERAEGDGNAPIALETKGVTVQFGGLTAVSDISFAVREGELFGLIGPNGAGKSTLLNVVAGAVRPASGTVALGSRDITKVPLVQRVGLGISRSFQSVELFPTLTVVQNLLLGRHCLMKSGVFAGALFFGKAKREEVRHREAVEDIIDLFELYPYRHSLAGSLPYGVQKLVGVARAVCAEPQLILLDEPASGLNREEREDLARFLLRLKHDRGTTMIWVEHDVAMVRDLADRVLALSYGVRVGEGTPEEVLGMEAVQESFLGGASGTTLTA
jgi:branched-chain amino acid transport system ATP-binding protein